MGKYGNVRLRLVRSHMISHDTLGSQAHLLSGTQVTILFMLYNTDVTGPCQTQEPGSLRMVNVHDPVFCTIETRSVLALITKEASAKRWNCERGSTQVSVCITSPPFYQLLPILQCNTLLADAELIASGLPSMWLQLDVGCQVTRARWPKRSILGLLLGTFTWNMGWVSVHGCERPLWRDCLG